MFGDLNVCFYKEALPYLLSLLPGANQRAAVAVSGVAAERPMEPKGFAPPVASLREKKDCQFPRTLLTCQQHNEVGRLGPLGRRLTPLCTTAHLSRAYRTFRFPFSVLRGGNAAPVTRVWW